MKRFFKIVVSLTVLLLGGTLSSFVLNVPELRPGNKGADYKVGDVVVNFTLRNVDDKLVSLSDFASKQGIILVFTSNHCPFSKSYEDRILLLDRKYAPLGFSVVAINPNDPRLYEDDTFEQMKERAKTKGYTYPYLCDENQQVARLFGAIRTPQVFVLKNTQGKFVVAYTGTVDDNPQDASAVKRAYVENAVTNLLEGKPVATTKTKPIGCPIKWKEVK
jgi:peroxiredoxin